MAGKFEIKLAKDGSHYFNLKAGNGQVILKSEMYTTRAACDNGIESVQKNASDEGRFELKESNSGKPMFNLKAGNGQVIGTSELYESESARDNGVESVMKNAPDAEVEDCTE